MLSEFKLHGSGGHVMAELTQVQAEKADLGVGKLLLAPIGKLETDKMLRHYCKICKEEFDAPPNIRIEEKNNEKVSENLTLVERGQYTCKECDATIGEYRVFKNTG